MSKFLGFLVAIALMAISATPPAAIAATVAVNDPIAVAEEKVGQWEAITRVFKETPEALKKCSVREEIFAGLDRVSAEVVELPDEVTTKEEATKVIEIQSRLQEIYDEMEQTTCKNTPSGGGKSRPKYSV